MGETHALPFQRAECHDFWHRRELGRREEATSHGDARAWSWAAPAGHRLGQREVSRWDAQERGACVRERRLGDTDTARGREAG